MNDSLIKMKGGANPNLEAIREVYKEKIKSMTLKEIVELIESGELKWGEIQAFMSIISDIQHLLIPRL